MDGCGMVDANDALYLTACGMSLVQANQRKYSKTHARAVFPDCIQSVIYPLQTTDIGCNSRPCFLLQKTCFPV